MVERSPEEEERYQASLDASKLLRPDTYELSLSDFAQVRVDLEFAAGELHALLTDETDADRKTQLRNALTTLSGMIEKIP